MRRLLVLALLAFTLAMGSPALASAQADQSPIGGRFAHPHHVHLPTGECVDIDAVRFEPGTRGLHQGAEKSGPAHGPIHGTCEVVHDPGEFHPRPR